MTQSRFRMIVDPLYGQLVLDDVLSDLITQPEVQRLRFVRLSNINSLLLPGGSNISRFEHSLGTALLARNAATTLGLSERDRVRLECAALLHDVSITPFGHLMEEGFRYAGLSFDHETRLEEVFYQGAEIGNVDRQVFRGRTAGFRRVLEKARYRKLGIDAADILAIIRGEGELGRFIKGDIDIDNIDNICRMAYHIGVPFRKVLPKDIIRGFFLDGKELCFDSNVVALLEEWLDLRRRLYNVFMTNPVDFSAKAMLVEAIRLGLVGSDDTEPIIDEADWTYTDADLLDRLRDWPLTKRLVLRFETGDVFDILGMYWLNSVAAVEAEVSTSYSVTLRHELASVLDVDFEDVLVYWIKDKRTRRISNLPIRGRNEPPTANGVQIGLDSDRVLFGVVLGKKAAVNRAREELCRSYLYDRVGHAAVECDSRTLLREAFDWCGEGGTNQRKLF